MVELKLYKVKFKPMWGVPHGLIIAARNRKQAEAIMNKTLDEGYISKDERELEFIKVNEPMVIFFESGDY